MDPFAWFRSPKRKSSKRDKHKKSHSDNDDDDNLSDEDNGHVIRRNKHNRINEDQTKLYDTIGLPEPGVIDIIYIDRLRQLASYLVSLTDPNNTDVTLSNDNNSAETRVYRIGVIIPNDPIKRSLCMYLRENIERKPDMQKLVTNADPNCIKFQSGSYIHLYSSRNALTPSNIRFSELNMLIIEMSCLSKRCVGEDIVKNCILDSAMELRSIVCILFSVASTTQDIAHTDSLSFPAISSGTRLAHKIQYCAKVLLAIMLILYILSIVIGGVMRR